MLSDQHAHTRTNTHPNLPQECVGVDVLCIKSRPARACVVRSIFGIRLARPPLPCLLGPRAQLCVWNAPSSRSSVSLRALYFPHRRNDYNILGDIVLEAPLLEAACFGLLWDSAKVLWGFPEDSKASPASFIVVPSTETETFYYSKMLEASTRKGIKDWLQPYFMIHPYDFNSTDAQLCTPRLPVWDICIQVYFRFPFSHKLLLGIWTPS